MTPRERALTQLESAARNLARSREKADELYRRMSSMPSCSVSADFVDRIDAYVDGSGAEPHGDGTPCFRVFKGDDRLPRAAWCEHCQERQLLFDAIVAERRKRGGYTRAILAAARRLEREP